MTPIRYSPIHDLALSHRAIMANHAGWMVVESFAGHSESPLEAGLPQVGMADQSARGKIMVHGRDGYKVLTALGLPPPTLIGEGVEARNLSVFRLRNDQLFINTPPGIEGEVMNILENAETGDGRVTTTDVTHGRAQLQIFGPAAARLLSRVCAIDFHPLNFPDRSARQTGVAKTTQLVIRQDIQGGRIPAYFLIGARSLGEYLWDILLESGRDLDVRMVGRADLMALSGN